MDDTLVDEIDRYALQEAVYDGVYLRNAMAIPWSNLDIVYNSS